MPKKIAVMGLGFVGLTTALGLSEKGFDVYGYDISNSRTDIIKSGKVPFFEPGLEAALTNCLNINFFIADSPSVASNEASAIFLCVGTPCDEHTGKADLGYLFSAIDSIENCMSQDCVLIIKSTVPPGTADKSVLSYLQKKNIKCILANNPEFLREGKCWDDFMFPDRIVCGISDIRARAVLNEIYEGFNVPIHFVSLSTAEYVKYLSNTLLASLISWSNEMALIADSIGNIQIGKAFKILHEDKRWKGANITSYFYPGCGYGGYCLPKDTMAMVAQAKENGFTPGILNNVIAINEFMPKFIADKIKQKAKGKSLGILGLSFKPESDDVRFSPAANIINHIKDEFHKIYAYDPLANENFQKEYEFELINYCQNADELCRACDVVAIITTWPQFKGINNKYPDIDWIDCRYFLE